MIGWLSGVALASSHVDPPAHVMAARADVDWKAAGAEAVEALSAYLQLDTSNPPGNEADGVAFLGGLLDEVGISWEALPLTPRRASLIARLPGNGKSPPLCLMHHIDTATFEAQHWQQEPLSGTIVDGHLWGRGVLDMKGMGILQLYVMAWLARNEVPLDRDVILLAVADEEVDNQGALALAEPDVWAKIGCSHLINEGGIGVRDALFDGQAVHAISVAEKGILWVDVVASGRAGHGSVPYPADEAPTRLLQAMTALERVRPRFRIDDSLYTLLGNVGAHQGGLTGFVLQHRWLVRTVAIGQLKANETMRAVMHNTVHLTGMAGAQAPNVVPSQVRARYDCRLLPGTTPQEHLARLQDAVDGIEGVALEVLQSAGSNGSPVDDPVYQAIARYAVEGRPNAVAGPLLSVGFTDSLLLRPLGVNAYGYVPFEVTAEVAGTMHGHDERVPVDQVQEGLERLFSMVVEVAGSP